MSSTPGRKRVGFTAQIPAVHPVSFQSSDQPDSGSNGHTTPLQRSDVSQDELHQLGESIRLALGDEYPHSPQPPIAPLRDVQKPRPAIRKAARTPPEFYLNDEPNPFDDDELTKLPSPGAQVKERSGIEAQRRATKLSKSVGTYSTPVSRRNSQEDMSLMSPPVELQSIPRYRAVSATPDEDDDPQFMKRASMLLRQHTVRAAPDASVSPEDLYHVEAPLQSGQVTPRDLEVEDEHVTRPVKYRTGVLGTLLQVSNAAQASSRLGHSRNLSAGTFSGASTVGNTPSSSPPESGYSTPRGPGKAWFSRHHNNHSATSIGQLVGSSANSLARPAQRELGSEFEEQYKKTRPGMGKRSKSDESVLGFKKHAKRRDHDMKIKIHL